MSGHSIERDPVVLFMSWALAGLVLTLPTVFGVATPYLMLVLALVGLIYLLSRYGRKGLVADWPVRANALLFLILGLLFTVNAQTLSDALMAFNFTALLLFAPIYTLFCYGNVGRMPSIVPKLAFGGALATFALAAGDVFILGSGRAGHGLFLGPNRLAETAAILGFLALMGTDWQKRASIVYLLAPILALFTVLLCGSRGPLLAFPVGALIAIIHLGGRGLAIISGIGAAMLAVGGALWVSLDMEVHRALSVVTILADLFSEGQSSDYTTQTRLAMYAAGWHAFLESPLIGHGWANMVEAALPFVDEEHYDHIAGHVQLHNDFIDFAVSGGIIGIAAYLAFIAIPIYAVLRLPVRSRASIYGLVVLAAVYIMCGLTDLMIGFEFHTGMYIGLSAMILAVERRTTQHAQSPVPSVSPDQQQ